MDSQQHIHKWYTIVSPLSPTSFIGCECGEKFNPPNITYDQYKRMCYDYVNRKK